MSKYLLYTVFVMLLSTSFWCCQKATLMEAEKQESEIGGRNSEGASTDSTTVTPEFDINGWEGAIDADFTFGGEEQKG